jgi:ElaB/YqjD/DUF883 family membrane-anchored ribosome-binding protein
VNAHSASSSCCPTQVNLTTPTGELTLEEKMDQPRAKEDARNTAGQAGKEANDAMQRVGEQIQPALDQGKELVRDLATQASGIGTRVVGEAGDLLQNVAPQAKEAASNLYERGSQSGEYVRQYAAEQPITALLIAAAIGYGLAFLIHRR